MNDFTRRCYEALLMVPRGKVTTYGEIASYLGSRAYRAVGHAMSKNERAPEVPCHRVVYSDGRIGNYSGPGGKSRKISLLVSEGVRIEDGRIADLESSIFRFR